MKTIGKSLTQRKAWKALTPTTGNCKSCSTNNLIGRYRKMKETS